MFHYIRDIICIIQFEKNYELPDGQVITVGEETFRCVEPLFDISKNKDMSKYKVRPLDCSLQQMVYQSINKLKCDDIKNIKNTLYNNIVLAGGTSMFPNMDVRLNTELTTLYSTLNKDEKLIKSKVIAPKNRKYSSYIGASILSSLSLFEQLFVSKNDYLENGNNYNFDLFGAWNKEQMNNHCAYCFNCWESYDLIGISKNKIKIDIKQQCQYLCCGFLRQNNVNPTDIVNIITNYFSSHLNMLFVVKNSNDTNFNENNHSLYICSCN